MTFYNHIFLREKKNIAKNISDLFFLQCLLIFCEISIFSADKKIGLKIYVICEMQVLTLIMMQAL